MNDLFAITYKAGAPCLKLYKVLNESNGCKTKKLLILRRTQSVCIEKLNVKQVQANQLNAQVNLKSD